MSWNVGLSLGESFAEFSAVKGRTRIQRRWFLPRLSLVDGLAQIYKQHPDLRGQKVQLTTRLAQVIMRHRAGAHVALLVTAGFEQWPRIRQPVKERGFTLTPKRFRPLLSEDLIFGITERTEPSGAIRTPLKTEELEFLIPKLQLTETKEVAVGFLHSTVNPQHERAAAEILRNGGFEVLCSHEIEEPGNEVARWWRAVLNAYVAPAFHELEAQLEPVKKEHEIQLAFWSSDGAQFESDPRRYYSSTFGNVAALAGLPRLKKTKTILHLGLEQFLLIQAEEKSAIWQSDFGPVALPAPEFRKTKIQPTQFIASDTLHGALFENLEAGYEPGPMLFGRTLRPTFIDILYLQKRLAGVEGLNELAAPGVDQKLEQSLHATFKETLETPNQAKKLIEELGLSILAQELNQYAAGHSIQCTGALAPVLAPLLQAKLKGLSLTVEKNAEYAESLAAASLAGEDA
ncbi:MAG TPA: hydantoinase/oxoprolinase N-terminal domain-containing protein [Bdellovibrionales bacterium]|nr:hydantoinase/oxoprolinase N-terminal domain-containing protein [Bdellovibrionales bacterium]